MDKELELYEGLLGVYEANRANELNDIHAVLLGLTFVTEILQASYMNGGKRSSKFYKDLGEIYKRFCLIRGVEDHSDDPKLMSTFLATTCVGWIEDLLREEFKSKLKTIEDNYIVGLIASGLAFAGSSNLQAQKAAGDWEGVSFETAKVAHRNWKLRHPSIKSLDDFISAGFLDDILETAQKKGLFSKKFQKAHKAFAVLEALGSAKA